MEKNPLVLATAYTKARGLKLKIKDLRLLDKSFDFDKVLTDLVNIKLDSDDKLDPEKVLRGQKWYLEHLVEMSKLSTQDLFNECYEEAFPSVSSEAEKLLALDLI